MRFVLYFEYIIAFVFCRDHPYFRFGKIVFCVKMALTANKIALTANRVFLKTLSRSICTSFMITGSVQGVLKHDKDLSQGQDSLPDSTLPIT